MKCRCEEELQTTFQDICQQLEMTVAFLTEEYTKLCENGYPISESTLYDINLSMNRVEDALDRFYENEQYNAMYYKNLRWLQKQNVTYIISTPNMVRFLINEDTYIWVKTDKGASILQLSFAGKTLEKPVVLCSSYRFFDWKHYLKQETEFKEIFLENLALATNEINLGSKLSIVTLASN